MCFNSVLAFTIITDHRVMYTVWRIVVVPPHTKHCQKHCVFGFSVRQTHSHWHNISGTPGGNFFLFSQITWERSWQKSVCNQNMLTFYIQRFKGQFHCSLFCWKTSSVLLLTPYHRKQKEGLWQYFTVGQMLNWWHESCVPTWKLCWLDLLCCRVEHV